MSLLVPEAQQWSHHLSWSLSSNSTHPPVRLSLGVLNLVQLYGPGPFFLSSFLSQTKAAWVRYPAHAGPGRATNGTAGALAAFATVSSTLIKAKPHSGLGVTGSSPKAPVQTTVGCSCLVAGQYRSLHPNHQGLASVASEVLQSELWQPPGVAASSQLGEKNESCSSHEGRNCAWVLQGIWGARSLGVFSYCPNPGSLAPAPPERSAPRVLCE